MNIKFLGSKENFITKASNKYNVNLLSFICLRYKYLLIVLTFLLATTISKPAFAKVSLGFQMPVYMALLDKKIERQGYTPGFGMYIRFPAKPSIVSVGYEYYSPKIRVKEFYKIAQHYLIKDITSDGKINYHLLNALAKLPIPIITMRLGAGIGIATISDIGLSKNNKFKPTTIYNFVIDIGIPILTTASIDVGYRLIIGKFKLEYEIPYNGDDLSSIDSDGSVFNVGFSIGF